MAQTWSTPGCYEVAPNVYRIPLSMPNDGLRAVNVYAIDASTGLILIDGGWHVAPAVDELGEALAQIGRRMEDIAEILVTHVHRDHYTLAVELRRRTGAVVRLGHGESAGLRAVRELGSNVPVSSLGQLKRAGASEIGRTIERATADEPFSFADWEDPDAWLEPGEVLVGDRWLEVVSTPGHTKGHVVIHDAHTGTMFTGDHVLPTITPSIGFELGKWDSPLDDYLASLRLLLERDDAEMMPAHGPPGGSIHERVTALLAHHDARLRQTMHAVANVECASGLEVARQLRWTRRERAFEELDDFNQMMAVCETMAHLDVLDRRGDLCIQPGRHPASDDFLVM